jgi:hypothetical protein
VAFFEYNDATTDEQVDAMHAALSELPAQIDVIAGYSMGKDLGISDVAVDFAVVADFATAADYRTYRSHPAHQAVSQTFVTPIVAKVSRIQFEF